MRITNALFYNNSVNDYQRNMQELHKTNEQISSGRVIQNSFEDSGTFVDTMRLDYEVETLEQVKETSSKAQTFANNTDKTLNQVTSLLDQFKTKMTQSANESNSPTSLNALANDLEALRTNLVSVGNTSINGQFLLSGSALNVKPVSADGSYNGNDQNLEALIGSGVQIPYNVTGKDLFLGKDSDYNRMLSTNVKMLDQTKLHPETMTGENAASTEVYLNSENTIRDMVGDTDDVSGNDPDTVFYLSGKRPEGDTFSTNFNLSSSSKISDLLERIGQEYGNTSTNQVVDVQMNAHGQIEITDLKKGNTLLEMNLFGAVDRTAAGNADISGTGLSEETTVTFGDLNDGETLEIDGVSYTSTGVTAASDVANAIHALTFPNWSTSVSGSEVTFTSNTTETDVEDLIVTGSGASTVTVDKDESINDIDSLLANPNVDIIEFTKSNFPNQNTASAISSREDVFSPGRFYVGYPMKTSDGSNVEATTELQDFMGSTLDNIVFGGSNDAGGSPVTPTDLSVVPTTTVQDLLNHIESTFGTAGGNVTARLENGQIIVEDNTLSSDPAFGDSNLQITMNAQSGGNPQNAFSTPDGMNYDRRGFAKEGNELLGNVSQTIKESGEYATASTKLVDVAGVESLDTEKLVINGKDKDGDSFSVQMSFSNTAGTTFNHDGTTYSVFNAEGNPTKADDMTYQQLMDIVSMVTSGNLPTDTNGTGGIQADEYNSAITTAQNNVEVSLDYKGRMEVIDRKSSKTDIELSIYDKFADVSGSGSTLSFMANNAVTIEDPNIDFFKDLDEMIEAVRSGTFRMDADSGDPRNVGIENALRRIDHLSDHVTKEHTKIGSYSNALSQAEERSELLSLNVKEVRSEVIDVDIADAYMRFQQLTNAYQASLSTISKINSMSLLNHM